VSERVDIVARLRWYSDGVFDCPEEVLEEAAAEIARLREDRRWIPVGERLPEAGQQVLWLLDDDSTIDLDYTKPFNATHWQPLPPGPEGEEVSCA